MGLSCSKKELVLTTMQVLDILAKPNSEEEMNDVIRKRLSGDYRMNKETKRNIAMLYSERTKTVPLATSQQTPL